MGWVQGEQGMFLEVHERAGQLDQRLVETAVGICAAQPEVLQDVVGLIVLALVEQDKKGAVLFGELGFGLPVPRFQPGFQSVVFFHSLWCEVYLTSGELKNQRCKSFQMLCPLFSARERDPRLGSLLFTAGRLRDPGVVKPV